MNHHDDCIDRPGRSFLSNGKCRFQTLYYIVTITKNAQASARFFYWNFILRKRDCSQMKTFMTFALVFCWSSWIVCISFSFFFFFVSVNFKINKKKISMGWFEYSFILYLESSERKYRSKIWDGERKNFRSKFSWRTWGCWGCSCSTQILWITSRNERFT